MILIYAVVFILGLIFGSFFNVLIYRLPKKESIVFPASHCPSCNNRIAPYDNIPVLSYIILGGKCRHCKTHISAIYPAVELITGIMFLSIVLKYGFSILSAILIISYSVLLILSFIDLRYKEINVFWLILPSILLLGLYIADFREFISLNHYFNDLVDALIGMAAGLALIFIIRFAGKLILKKEAMGEADIYIAGFMGLLLGYKLFFFALAMGGILGLLYYPFIRKNNDPEIPFIPFLSLGTFVIHMLSNVIMRYIV